MISATASDRSRGAADETARRHERAARREERRRRRARRRESEMRAFSFVDDSPKSPREDDGAPAVGGSADEGLVAGRRSTRGTSRLRRSHLPEGRGRPQRREDGAAVCSVCGSALSSAPSAKDRSEECRDSGEQAGDVSWSDLGAVIELGLQASLMTHHCADVDAMTNDEVAVNDNVVAENDVSWSDLGGAIESSLKASLSELEREVAMRQEWRMRAAAAVSLTRRLQ